MLFYRQKLLLSLLDQLGGRVEATDFQKYLFLFSQKCEKDKSYDFVPYKSGCYSFQAVADKTNLAVKGYLADDSNWQLVTSNRDFSQGLKKNDSHKLELFAENYCKLKGQALIQQLYQEYPYFAINSDIAEQYLNPDQRQAVINARPKKLRKSVLATIGYEGGSVENYLNKLITHDIRLLVDVRKNPISRKYGFSKKTLSLLLSRLGIDYMHVSNLGIESFDRKNLNTQADYDALLTQYENTVLVEQHQAIEQVLAAYSKNRRIALTCFEKDHHQCHRSRLATRLSRLSNKEIPLIHL